MSTRTVPLFITLLIISLFAWTAPAQEEQETPADSFYNVETQLVSIPVYVTADGKPVPGLTADDFVVKERGRTVALESVDFLDHTTMNWQDYTDAPPESRRQFVFLFDLSFSNPNGLKQARQAAIDFLLQHIGPNDLVAVFTLSDRIGTQLLCPFGTKRDQAVYYISTLGLTNRLQKIDPAGYAYDAGLVGLNTAIKGAESASALQSEVNNLAGTVNMEEALSESLRGLSVQAKEADTARYASRVKVYTGQLEAFALGLQKISGRKNILFFSTGFDQKVFTGKTLNELSRDSNTMATLTTETNPADLPSGSYSRGSLQLQRNFARAMEQFRKANSVFYVIDTNRLAAGRVDAENREFNSVLYQFSEETGGEIFRNINDIGSILNTIAERTSASYLISFRPTSAGKPNEFRELRVELKRSGMEIDHQAGYSFPREYSEFLPHMKVLQLEEYIAKDIISKRIPFEVQAMPISNPDDGAEVAMLMKIPAAPLLNRNAQREQETVTLELLGYILNVENEPIDFFYETLSFKKDDATETFRDAGINFASALEARPGTYKAKFIVRDMELGNISSDIIPLSIPEYSEQELRMVGPVFIDNDTNWVRQFSGTKRQLAEGEEPVDIYPLKWKGNSWIPAIQPTYTAEEGAQNLLYARLVNLALHPEANIPQVTMKFSVMDSEGTSKTLGRVALADRQQDPENNVFELVFNMDFFGLELEPGSYTLKFELTDTLAEKTVSGTTDFILE